MAEQQDSVFLTPEKARALLEANQKTIETMIADGKILPRYITEELRATAVSDTLGRSANPSQLYAKSKAELAKLLGISKPTLDTIAKKPGAPGVESNNSYSVAKWRRFGAQHTRKIAADPEEAESVPRDLDPAYIRAKAQAEAAQLAVLERKFDLELKQSQYIKVADATSEVLRCNAVVKREITRGIAAVDMPPEIREKIEKAIQNAFENIHTGDFK